MHEMLIINLKVTIFGIVGILVPKRFIKLQEGFFYLDDSHFTPIATNHSADQFLFMFQQ